MPGCRNVVVGVLLAGLTACSSIGPTTIPRDRFDYSGALATSWKNQLLLNIVKTRYLDLPIYLEVGQIVGGYSMETEFTARGQVAEGGGGDTFLGMGGRRTYTDRPTITYTPLTGERFLKSFLTPLHPAKVLTLVQSGFAADFVLELTGESLNGLHNRPVAIDRQSSADPDFFHALALLRQIQAAGAVGLRLDYTDPDHPTTLVSFLPDRRSPDVLTQIEQLRGLLGLAADLSEFRLVQSPLPGGPGELAIATRSVAQITAALAQDVEVPPTHVQRRLAPVVALQTAAEPSLLHVLSGSAKPEDAFVAVSYEGEWFWVANDDWRSKRTIFSMLFLFTLADAGGPDQMPVLTIPTQ